MKIETAAGHSAISTSELPERLAREPRPEFWNVLTGQYYSGENIPGSVHVPLDRIGRETAAGRLPKDAEIIVYCTGPECPQSASAAEKLAALGYTNVRVYEGGFDEWEAAGHPIVRDARPFGEPFEKKSRKPLTLYPTPEFIITTMFG